MRDITQIFISRAELLPEGETLEDYKKWQQEEADIVEKDRRNNGSGGGLFGGRFRHSLHHGASAIIDVEDGVDRCPLCAWELTDEGYCSSCGFEIDDGFPLSGSASPSISYFTEDENGAFLMDDDMGIFDSLAAESMSALEESVHGDIIPPSNTDRRASSRMSGEVETRHTALRSPRITLGASRPLLFPSAVRRRYSEIVTDDEFGDTDGYSSEEDDAGSLREFIVEEDEMEDEHRGQPSPQSSHYDSDEATGIFEALEPYSSEGHSDGHTDSGVSREEESHEPMPASSLNIITVEDDDSDEGPVLRSRGRAYRKPRAYPESNISERANVPIIRPQNSRPQSTRESTSHASGSNSPLTDQSNAQNVTVSDSSSARSGPVSLDSESDSDPSPPVRRSRARPGRGGPSRIISDDEDGVATVSSSCASASRPQTSSGTMTIGRQSPARSDSQGQTDLATGEPPVVLSSYAPRQSSPAAFQQLDASAGDAHRSRLPDAERTHESPRRNIRSGEARGSHHNSWSPRRHVQPSRAHQATVSRTTGSTSNSHTIQRIQRIAHERVVRRAGRLLKKERTQRRARERAVTDLAGFGSPIAAAASGGMGLRWGVPRQEWDQSSPTFDEEL